MTTASAAVSVVEKPSASRTPIRSPSRDMSATWIEPASPAATASVAAAALPDNSATGGSVALPEAERVPLGVLAGGKPAVARHRRFLTGSPAVLCHLGKRGVDVLGVEVDGEVARLGAARDRAALVLAGLEHPVVHLRRHRRAD